MANKKQAELDYRAQIIEHTFRHFSVNISMNACKMALSLSFSVDSSIYMCCYIYGFNSITLQTKGSLRIDMVLFILRFERELENNN